MPSIGGRETADFIIGRKAAGFELGKYRRIVAGYFERTAATGGYRYAHAPFDQQVPRTEGARLVVSALAVFDVNVHGGLSGHGFDF